jgi:hypothetical protein
VGFFAHLSQADTSHKVKKCTQKNILPAAEERKEDEEKEENNEEKEERPTAQSQEPHGANPRPALI